MSYIPLARKRRRESAVRDARRSARHNCLRCAPQPNAVDDWQAKSRIETPAKKLTLATVASGHLRARRGVVEAPRAQPTHRDVRDDACAA